jgi:hypothetical protein
MNNTDWVEPLPPGCPPSNAYPPQDLTVFRAVKQYPPIEEDFLSHKALYPHRQYEQECMFRGISLTDNIDQSRRLLLLPNLQKKGMRIIVSLIIPESSGVILRGDGDPNHINWWRRKGFDPILASSLIE